MAVSVQQASANAFVTWLQALMPDVTVYSRWPKTILTPKAISVITAGARRDTILDPEILSKTNVGAANTTAIYRVACCFQPMQLDIWTTSHNDRDDIVARLDGFLRADASALAGAFNPMPVGNGVLVALADGWTNTIADFQFHAPTMDDTSPEQNVDQYRASYRGGANVMLSVVKTTARQKIISFQLLLSQNDQDAETTTYRIP